MVVAGHPAAELSISEAEHLLRGAIEGDDLHRAKAVLAVLGDAADTVAASGDVREIARHRDRLDRLARRLRKLEVAQREVAIYAYGYLDDADRRLDRARTRALGAQAAERYERESLGVRDRVLALLAVPQRPRDVAERLTCDRTQVSRALKELQDAGLVTRVPAPPHAGGDRRAHWYAQTQLSVPSAA